MIELNTEQATRPRSCLTNAPSLCQILKRIQLLKRWKKEHERRMAEGLKGSSQKIEEVTEVVRRLDWKMGHIAEDIAIVSRRLSVKVQIEATPCQLLRLKLASQIRISNDKDINLAVANHE